MHDAQDFDAPLLGLVKDQEFGKPFVHPKDSGSLQLWVSDLAFPAHLRLSGNQGERCINFGQEGKAYIEVRSFRQVVGNLIDVTIRLRPYKISKGQLYLFF